MAGLTLPPAVAAALAATCLAAAVAAFGAVSLDGAIAGAGLAFVFALRAGPVGLGAFAALVALGTAATRVGWARKAALGAAQRHGGRRGARHALANAGPAAAILLLAPDDLGILAAVAALAASASDTVSSELGVLARERPRLLLLGRVAAAGEDGAMSWTGTAAGVLAAAGLAFGADRALPGAGVFLPVFAGAVAGNLADSLLGATIESRLPRSVGNEAVNAAASAIGGATAFLIAGAPA